MILIMLGCVFFVGEHLNITIIGGIIYVDTIAFFLKINFIPAIDLYRSKRNSMSSLQKALMRRGDQDVVRTVPSNPVTLFHHDFLIVTISS